MLEVVVAILGVAVALLGWAVWLISQQARKAEKTSEYWWQKYLDLDIEYRHHLTTMRKEGFTFQPMDESFEPYRLTPEYEAQLEEAQRGNDE